MYTQTSTALLPGKHPHLSWPIGDHMFTFQIFFLSNRHTRHRTWTHDPEDQELHALPLSQPSASHRFTSKHYKEHFLAPGPVNCSSNRDQLSTSERGLKKIPRQNWTNSKFNIWIDFLRVGRDLKGHVVQTHPLCSDPGPSVYNWQRMRAPRSRASWQVEARDISSWLSHKSRGTVTGICGQRFTLWEAT